MKISKYLLILIMMLSSGHLIGKENAVYTIEGKKDKRLEATYKVSYISNKDIRECSDKIESIDYKRKPKTISDVIKIQNDNYQITIPTSISRDNCDFAIKTIRLIIRRNYDDLYTRYLIFGKGHQSPVTYFGKGKDIQKKNGRTFSVKYDGWRGGKGHNRRKEPLQFWTDKAYFQMAPETNFLCQTKLYQYKSFSKKIDESDFHCIMRIKDGLGENAIQRTDRLKEGNPQLGANEIIDTTLKINVLVDDNVCSAYFDKDKSNEPYPFVEIEKPFSFLGIF